MKLNEFFFKSRSFTPIPLVLTVLFLPASIALWVPEAGDKLFLGLIIGSGALIILFGELIRFYSAAHASQGTRTKRAHANRLYSGGPYGHVRNPLYIGNFFIMLGCIVMSWTWFPWLPIIAVILFAVQYMLIVKHEEEALVRDLGDEYIEYRKNVPRFIPGIKSYDSGNKPEPDYKKAVKNEMHTIRAEVFMVLFIVIRWYVVLK